MTLNYVRMILYIDIFFEPNVYQNRVAFTEKSKPL